MERADKKISEMTLGELLNCIDEHFAERERQSGTIDGIKGLAEYLHCSVRTATRLKASGRIDKAVIQSGRTIVIDKKQLIRELAVRGL